MTMPGLIVLIRAPRRPHRTDSAITRSELVPLLEEFSTPFPGYYLCYPQRRQASPALRALIEPLRETQRRRRAPKR